MTKRSPSGDSQSNKERASKPFQRTLWHRLPPQAQILRREEWFHGPSPGSHCPAQPWDTVPCIPATPPLVVAQRSTGTTGAATSENAGHKPWWFPYDFLLVLSRRVHRGQELRLGNFRLDFRGCIGKPGCQAETCCKGGALTHKLY